MSHHHKCKCEKEEPKKSAGILDCLCGGNNGWLMFLIFVLLIIGVSGCFGEGFI